MILEQPLPYPLQPRVTLRPDVIDGRGGLEQDRFFPQELLGPARREQPADDDLGVLCSSFTPRWWNASSTP